jgi:CheY-like chemotaxis protein
MKNRNSLDAYEPAPGLGRHELNSRQSILVVDDELAIRLINSEILIEAGYRVDVAEDGATAWDKLQRINYDLLVTDHEMPKLTGVELLRNLHAASMLLPKIMVTGAYPTGEFMRCPWLLPTATLLKPYTFSQLAEIVKEVLRATDLPGGSPNQGLGPIIITRL